MSRSTYPTQLRDHLGNEVRLPAKPFATGGEGAVFDVVNRPGLVAKIYSKPQSKERCDKLRAMAALCSPDLLKFAAWPTTTLSNGISGSVEGILMPRVVDYKEIHHLYSVAQRKKDFPEIDWGFLLHTARNCAIAFESIHSHGHVVGDVNQKNVMVSKKGLVALVDCDSFQVKEGGRIFRCGVGVPEYTPPELQGRKFTDLDRDANHDLFGLAVMVFHLLMMGRHPFAGVPQMDVDIPIEKAIREGLYAYTRNPTKLRPPPHVPPVTMLDAATLTLFERAFGSQQRPTASEWRSVLDVSLAGLQRCKNDHKHSFPATAGSCPWCQLIAVSRLMFFIPSQGVAGPALRIEDIRHLIEKLAAIELEFSSYVRPRPSVPVKISLPVWLRAIQKPALLVHPAPPTPVPKPVPSPHPTPPMSVPRPVLAPPLAPPLLLARPLLRPLPVAPVIPAAPLLMPYPPRSLDPSLPRLHSKPPPPVYPPVPISDPPDPFLSRIFIAAALAGVPVYFIAKPVGVIVVVFFAVSWLVMLLTKPMRIRMAQQALEESHKIECSMLDEGYAERIRPIEKVNMKLMNAWESAKAADAADYARRCEAIDVLNRRIIAPWEAAKAAIEAEHRQATYEVERANLRDLSTWEAENAARQRAHEYARLENELGNQRLMSEWATLTASRNTEYEKARRKVDENNRLMKSSWELLIDSHQAGHDKKCREIDAKNRQLIAEWEAANTPWIEERERWRNRKLSAELEINRLELELLGQRTANASRFQQRKIAAEGVLKSHDGARQDYERELRRAEIDSQRIQLEEDLDKWLISKAKLKGITYDRILALESFGIETAKDVEILNYQKVPGIGPVLSKRLFDWRDKLASSFRPQKGLPESEKSRIATRYAPVLLPLAQTIQAAINDLEAIVASHRSGEAARVKAIAEAAQEMAVAEAHFEAMKLA